MDMRHTDIPDSLWHTIHGHKKTIVNVTMVLIISIAELCATFYARRRAAIARPNKPEPNNQIAAGTGTADTPDTRTTKSL